MAETPEPPTFFANIATVQVSADEISMEFRRILMPHSTLWRRKEGKELIPPPTDEEVYKFPAIAKVVLTFTAAKALRDNLNLLLPNFEQQRRQGA